jgi:puromycin-sensitive aminopeptidase
MPVKTKLKIRKSVRLPGHVTPQRYQIMLKPDLDAFTFSGEETIFFTLSKATKQITLHSKDLKIISAEVVANHKNGKNIWAGKISYNGKAETATFTFPKAIGKGKHQLKLTFQGVLNDQLHGLYRSKYEHKGQTKHLVVSQFEATDARRAFPCFDEPAQKAVFDVTLMIPKHLAAVSNTIETSVTHHDNGFKVVKFAPTPKMSTYLLAFIVGEMDYIEGKTKDGVLVRIFTTPGKKQQARFALEVGIKTLEFFNKYFDIPYPLPVLDMLAIPDFAAAAMENWGAVTYRETALLVDEKHTPLLNKQYVAHVIAHELTHQWFGNLVTMEWWTHLWLNEGFATYMSYLAVDELFPGWHMWTQFIFQDMGAALKLDALNTTHPIEVEVHHPSEISEIFDAVSYNKGASVIRMLADYLGAKDFRNGLRYYLKKHSYKNTSTIHLWEAFEKISGKPVTKMMRIWTRQPGFPLVSVTDTGDGLLLKQSRFFSSPVTKQSIKDTTTWPVPVKYNTDGAKPKYALLDRKQLTINLKGDQAYLKVNSGEVGFYSTQYEPALLQALYEPIRTQKLSQDDRMGIIRDAFALALAGDLPIIQALTLAEQYKNETSYNVWVEVISGLAEVDSLLVGSAARPQFHRYVLNLLSKIKQQVNWQPKAGEPNNTTLLRTLILGALGLYGDKATIRKAKQIFREQQSKIHPDIRATVYYITAQSGAGREYEQLLRLYHASDVHEEKNRLARALMLFLSAGLIKRSLKFAFSKAVRLQDAPFLFLFAWRNTQAWPHLWQYLQTHWEELRNKYDQGGRFMGHLIKPLSHYSDPKTVQQIKKFLIKHPVPSAAMVAAQTLEHLEANMAWRKRELQALERFLVQGNKSKQ